MRTTAQKYLDGARGRAGQFHNHFGNEMTKRNMVGQPANGFNATGGSAPAAAPTSSVTPSMPYGFTVSSASGVAVQNFDVLGSYQYINNPGFSADGASTLTTDMLL